MSNFEDAKLILTPNAYKAGKAYSVKPFDGSGDLTVVRNTTATRVNENGLIELVGANVPRLNYPIGGGCPSWLVEPQSTNVITYSEDFSDASWIKTNSGTGTLPVITSNAEIAPDGNLTADEFDLTGSTTARVFKINSISGANNSNQSYFSVYLKAKLSDGTVVIQSRQSDGTLISKFCDVVVSEWRRFDLLKPFNSSSLSSSLVFIGNRSSGGTCNVFYAWGAQLEQGNLTSYIPTNGTAVTRNGDVLSKTGISSLIGQTEGTIYLEASFFNNDLTPKYITISDNTNSKRIILASTTISNQVRVQLVDSVSQVEIFHTLSDITDFNKFAFVYAENNFKFFINGALVGSDNSGTVPSGFNTLLFSNPGNILQFQGDVKSLILFDTAKPDAELINLTTI